MNWKQKFKSRKFWITVITMATGLTAFLLDNGVGDSAIWKLVLTVITAIAYIATEGAIDLKAVNTSNTVNQAQIQADAAAAEMAAEEAKEAEASKIKDDPATKEKIIDDSDYPKEESK
jgi:hypothetical protein